MAEPADKPDSPTRARAILTVAERVDHIAGMMERFEWVRGKSGPKLAAEWGVTLGVVEKASSEAHRRITADKDEAERDISVGARKLFREAVALGDAKAAKLMGDLWADVSGAKAPTKQDLRVAAVALDELDALKKSAESNECPTEPETTEKPEPNS
jgi:hypothetical protein